MMPLRLSFVRRLALSAVTRRKAQEISSSDEFNLRVLKSEHPVVVNFHADWCDPCKILTPRLKQLVEPLEDVELAIVDVEKNPELVEHFEVKAIPAVVGFRAGQVVDKFIGLVDEEMIGKLMLKLTDAGAESEKKSC